MSINMKEFNFLSFDHFLFSLDLSNFISTDFLFNIAYINEIVTFCLHLNSPLLGHLNSPFVSPTFLFPICNTIRHLGYYMYCITHNKLWSQLPIKETVFASQTNQNIASLFQDLYLQGFYADKLPVLLTFLILLIPIYLPNPINSKLTSSVKSFHIERKILWCLFENKQLIMLLNLLGSREIKRIQSLLSR